MTTKQFIRLQISQLSAQLQKLRGKYNRTFSPNSEVERLQTVMSVISDKIERLVRKAEQA